MNPVYARYDTGSNTQTVNEQTHGSRIMNPAQRLLWLGGLGALLGASPAMANKVTELDIAPGNNPVFPTLEVYSLN
ncbi:MAG TPA: hypothetical protein ENK00_04450, partial [Chromatiales bacterium]|nr:hypothetical protein [Chromatiales bacterium]